MPLPFSTRRVVGQNLVAPSRGLASAPWTKLGSSGTLTNVTTEKRNWDGVADATKYQDAVDGSAVTHNVGFVHKTLTVGEYICIRVRLAPGTLSQLAILSEDGVVEAFYDFTTGVDTVTVTAGVVTNSSISPPGTFADGHRELLFACKITGSTQRMRLALGKGGTRTYQGDGTGYLYIGEVSVEQSKTAGPLITTGATVVDYGRSSPPLGSVPGTNLFIQSDDLQNVQWTLTAQGLTPGQADPFGGNKAFLLAETATTTNQRFYQTTAANLLAAGSWLVFSIYAKQFGARRWAVLDVNDAAGTFGWMDLQTGTRGILQSNSPPIYAIQPVPNAVTPGWYRIFVACQFGGGGGTRSISYGLTTGDGVAAGVGDGTGRMLFYGPQWEPGKTPSPYVPTKLTIRDNGGHRYNPWLV